MPCKFEVGKTYPSVDGTRMYKVVADKMGISCDEFLATYQHEDGCTYSLTLRSNGKYKYGDRGLDMAPPFVKKVGYSSVHKDFRKVRYISGEVSDTEEEAMKKADTWSSSFIGIAKIEWEEPR